MKDNSIKNIAILGSTGSIGTQALDIISRFPDKFHASVLTANHNWELLVKQALIFKPETVVIANADHYEKVRESLRGQDIDIKAGSDHIAEAVTLPDIDIVLTAMVGYSGLLPTVNAIKAGKTIALANKETLVVAGELITKLVKEFHTRILPVDSEHSAIFQCLKGEQHAAMKKIILTASGGPFRTYSDEQMKHVTVKEALNHPNWQMGNKVTIDSASMMNKGFEMIEARWLFDCLPQNIEILVHPQSIVHSMVEFKDGSIKAQLGVPDMHLPIQYALGYPERLTAENHSLDWHTLHKLTFELPDYKRFPLLQLAFDAIKKGGNAPCMLNAANEVAVRAFLNEEISFSGMADIALYTMENTQFINNPDLQQLVETNREAVEIAKSRIKDKNNYFVII